MCWQVTSGDCAAVCGQVNPFLLVRNAMLGNTPADYCPSMRELVEETPIVSQTTKLLEPSPLGDASAGDSSNVRGGGGGSSDGGGGGGGGGEGRGGGNVRSVNAWQAVETLPLMIDEHGSQDVMALDTLSRDCGFRYPVRGRTSIKSHNYVIFDISPCMFEALNCPS